MRRGGPILIAGLALLAAGCGGERTGSALPLTVEGTLPTTQTTTPTAPTVKGDATAGKAVFASAGCGACHTFAPAASSGKVGPDLDHIADYAKKANEPLDQFTSSAITHPPPPYIPPGFPTTVMPTTFGSSLSPKQLADLVAFVDQGAK